MKSARSIAQAVLLAAVAFGAVAPAAADAQGKPRKEATRVTAQQRKAAAEARKAKMDEAKRLYPEVHGDAAKAARAKGGSR